MLSLGRRVIGGWLLLSLLGACSGEPGGPDPGAIPVVPSELDPGSEVAVSAPAGVGELGQQLASAREVTPDELRAEHAVAFQAELGYDPLSAANLQPILDAWGGATGSAEAMRSQLSQTGFAVRPSWPTSSFAYGYSEIYSQDLPVFVSADMVLEAVFRSHDKILQALEKQALKPRLERVLGALRGELIAKADTFEPEVASDLNFFLGVAVSLLNGEVDERESADVKSYYAAAVAAAGEQERILFGVERRLDFSQFKPRGHYDGDAALERYFRAMIWLGRTDFRLIETREDGKQVLRRRQVESVIALRKLLSGSAFADYLAIDKAVTAFVGEHDYMTLQEVDELLAALGAAQGIETIDDETLAGAIVASGFGEQRIASQVMRRQAGGDTFPLNLKKR